MRYPRVKCDQNNDQMADNNAMHANPGLRVFLEWMVAGSGSVITAVIPLALISL